MKRVLVFLLTVFLFQSCSKKTAPDSVSEVKTKSASAETQNIPETRNPELYRVVVSFYSRGEGIDDVAVGAFKNFISDFQSNQPNTITVEETPWGREGEIDYCIQFTGNNAAFQTDFVATIKSLLIDCQLAHILENNICRHKR